MKTEEIYADIGKFWDYRELTFPHSLSPRPTLRTTHSHDLDAPPSLSVVSDPQLRWIGPEKGVIHLAVAAVINAVWDLYAKSRNKPLWKLIVDFTPEEFVRATTFRYITDAITKEEALALLKKMEPTKKQREAEVLKRGYPAYTTSAGWLGYSDEK
jgi:L-fuconate dehydratase